MVEHVHGKDGVTGSIPVDGSTKTKQPLKSFHRYRLFPDDLEYDFPIEMADCLTLDDCAGEFLFQVGHDPKAIVPREEARTPHEFRRE